MTRSISSWLVFASIFSVPHAVVGSDAPPVGDGSCTATQGCEDPSSMLQARLTKGGRHHRQASLGQKAATFEGGGFASVSTQAAIVAGLLATLAPPGTEPSLEGSGLFDQFAVLSSNSGGSWFLSSMLYSSNVVEMVEEMAAKPADAGTIFNDQYMNSWLLKADATATPMWADLMDYAASEGWAAMYDQWSWTDFIFNSGGWAGFVQQLLNDTSGGQITSETTLADSLSWAKGKTWLVCHSQVTPTGKKGGALLAADAKLSSSYIYKVTGVSQTTDLPPYVPARWSMSLGAGADAPAPVSYIAEGAWPASARGQWEARWTYGLLKSKATSPAYGDFSNFVDNAGKLPVWEVVAASSATFGGLTTVPDLRALDSDSIGDMGPAMAVWAAIEEAEPFKAANEIVEPLAKFNAPVCKKTNKQLAQSGLFPLVDGAYTDNTGISHVISTGATELTSFVTWGSMKDLFSTSPDETLTWNSTGGTNPMLIFPILTFENLPQEFKSAQQYAEYMVDNTFSNLTNAATPYSVPIKVGVFDCVTLANPWFNIPAGKKVKINYIGGGDYPTLGVGSMTNLTEYGVAVGGMVEEIVAAQQENPAAYNMLKSFFFSD